MMAAERIKGEFLDHKIKRKWPILLILLAIAFPILNLFVFDWIDFVPSVEISIVLIIIGIIFRNGKLKNNNKLIVTDMNVSFIIDGQFYFVPINQITYLDKGKKNHLGIATANRVFDIEKLKNKDDVATQIEEVLCYWQEQARRPEPQKVPEIVFPNFTFPSASAQNVVVPHSNAETPIISEVNPIPTTAESQSEEPLTIEEMLKHNQMLYKNGKISLEEKNRRNAILFKDEFPELYGGKAKRIK